MAQEDWSTRSVCGTTPAHSVGSPSAHPPSPTRSSETDPSSHAHLQPNHDSSNQNTFNGIHDVAHNQFGNQPAQHGYGNTLSYSPDSQYINNSQNTSSQAGISTMESTLNYTTAVYPAVLHRFESGEEPWNSTSPTEDPDTHRRRVSEAFGQLGPPQDYRHEEVDPDKLQEEMNEMERNNKKRRRENSKSKSRSPPDKGRKNKHHKRDRNGRGGPSHSSGTTA